MTEFKRRSARLSQKEQKNVNEEEMWKKYESYIQEEKDHHDAIWNANRRKKSESISLSPSQTYGTGSVSFSITDFQLKCMDDTVVIYDKVMKQIQFLQNAAIIHLKLSQKESEELIQEYGKFLVLKMINKDYNHKQLSPSAQIDKIWHLHLLYPKQYYLFCQTNCNGHIINHCPDAKLDGNQKKRLQNTIKLYQLTFGTPPKHIWTEEIISPPKPVRAKRPFRFRPC